MQKWMLMGLLLFSSPVFAACETEQWPRAALVKLKADAFVIEDDTARFQAATHLLGCLTSPDPQLRDGVAFEAFSAWFRQNKFNTEQLNTLYVLLSAQLQVVDAEGFNQPFTALVLSELARTDRVRPWMSTEQRLTMVQQANAYMKSIRDYRGFEPDSGWRHGVAHAADWLLQLSVNSLVDAPQVLTLTDAVAAQVTADNQHSYTFGEPGRLARPVLFAARRGVRTQAEWEAWMKALTDRLEPAKAYRDREWLVKRHNLAAFFQVLYLETDISAEKELDGFKAAVFASLKNLP
jgi:Protein of unknown function (DUF2785)